MITKQDMATLERLSKRAAAAPSMDDEEISRVQRLVSQGLARDHSAFHGTRTPVRLRIWTITSAGRAILEQKDWGVSSPRQLTLTNEDRHGLHLNPTRTPHKRINAAEPEHKTGEGAGSVNENTPTTAKT